MSTIHTKAGHLEQECQRILGGLRTSLVELFAAIDADPATPQHVARRFGLNKNLTWKLSKIVSSIDGFGAIQHLPGAAGWDIFLSTATGAGAPDNLVQHVRRWLREFDEFVTLHAGDRTNLELMLDSMGVSNSGTGQLDHSRQLAFQGNSGIWGVQARARLTAGIIVPSRNDPAMVDAALIGGLVGFRRLRPNVSWPLFRFAHLVDSAASRDQQMEEIELKKAHGDVPRLLRRFCSPDMPQIDSRKVGTATEYILPAGPIGNSGSFSCFFGDIFRGQPRYRHPDDPHCEFGSHITLPVETLVFDLLIHQQLALDAPTVMIFGRPDGTPYGPDTAREENLIPVTERCINLAGRPPAVSSPLIPRYAELMQSVFDRLGFPADEFRGHRLVLKHPPMNSTVVLRSPLPEGPR